MACTAHPDQNRNGVLTLDTLMLYNASSTLMAGAAT